MNKYNIKVITEKLKNDCLDQLIRHQTTDKILKYNKDNQVIEVNEFMEFKWDNKERIRRVKLINEWIDNNEIVLGYYNNEHFLKGILCLSRTKLYKNNEYNQLLVMHISNDCRGQGIGTQMLEKAYSMLDKNDNLIVVGANPAIKSQSFYESKGYYIDDNPEFTIKMSHFDIIRIKKIK